MPALPGVAGQLQSLGCVVPKRHARRAVTRTLMKRQIRASYLRHLPGLPAGWWLVRLTQGFAVAEFPSAASQALSSAARAELDALWQRAIDAGAGGPSGSRSAPRRRPARDVPATAATTR